MASRKEECKDEAAAAARQTDSQEIVSKTLDEAKDNTKRAIEEARRDISARTAIFNEYQEQSITAARDIVGAIHGEHVRDVLDQLDVSKVNY